MGGATLTLVLALVLAIGCSERPEPPLGAPPGGWRRLAIRDEFTLDVPAAMHEGPPVMDMDYRMYLEYDHDKFSGGLVGSGLYVRWHLHDGHDWPKSEWREARNRTRYWTETRDLRRVDGLTRFSSADAACASVADDRRLVWVTVLDSIPGDSTTVKSILHSVRLLLRK